MLFSGIFLNLVIFRYILKYYFQLYSKILLFSGISYAQILLNGFIRSFGIIYVELLDVYQEGPLTTSWIPSSYAMAIMITGM